MHLFTPRYEADRWLQQFASGYLGGWDVCPEILTVTIVDERPCLSHRRWVRPLLYYRALPHLRGIILEFECATGTSEQEQQRRSEIEYLERNCGSILRKDRWGIPTKVQLQGPAKERLWSDTSHSIEYRVYTLAWEVSQLDTDEKYDKSWDPKGEFFALRECSGTWPSGTYRSPNVAICEEYRRKWNSEESLLKFAAGSMI
jgi:hypothetical protein